MTGATSHDGGGPPHIDLGPTRLDVLSQGECLERLRQYPIGRVALVLDGRPVVLPVNYRVIDDPATAGALPLLVLRMRTGGVVAIAGPEAALEVDEIDMAAQTGWWVLVQGRLRPVDAEHAAARDRVDPHPRAPDRDSWVLIEPVEVSGRRLTASEFDWSTDPRNFL